MPEALTNEIGWLREYWVQIALSLVVAAAYFALEKATAPRVAEGADNSNFSKQAGSRATLVLRSVLGLFAVVFLAGIWGIDFGTFAVVATTVLTVVGVALFASWSLLSNVTAFFVLLLQPSFQRGSYIRVLELDNYIEGRVAEISLFNTKLITDTREVVIYPNNLLLARPMVVNPREHWKPVGKTVEKRDNEEAAT